LSLAGCGPFSESLSRCHNRVREKRGSRTQSDHAMICREYQFIFVHIPKAAGQSIEQFFMDCLGLDWDSDRTELLMGDNEDPSRGTQKLAHLSASEYVQCGFVPPSEFDRLFKFSFVRNPYSRIVSEYLYRNYFHHRSFRDFVLNRLPQPGWDDQYRHVMPQYDMLHDADGTLLVDYVGRFENLQQDFNEVCRRLGIEAAELPHRNPSDKKSRKLRRKLRDFLFRNGEGNKSKASYRDFYDDETREAVSRYYRNDIETFNYRFDP